jgi:FeS assembly SUF system protein
MSEPLDVQTLEDLVVEALRTVYDPEIPVNIFELGLIYDVEADPSGAVLIRMTLTSPSCPVAESLPRDVERKVEAVQGVTAVMIDLVWDPPWDPGMMSDAAKLELNMY